MNAKFKNGYTVIIFEQCKKQSKGFYCDSKIHISSRNNGNVIDIYFINDNEQYSLYVGKNIDNLQIEYNGKLYHSAKHNYKELEAIVKLINESR